VPDEEVDAFLPRAQVDHAAVGFRGEFEGLWTDRIDVDAVLARRCRAGQLSDGDLELLTHWLERGYVVLPGAVSVDTCEAVKSDLRSAFERGDELMHTLGREIEFEELDRDKALAFRIVRPKHRSESPRADLMKNTKWSERVWRRCAGSFRVQ